MELLNEIFNFKFKLKKKTNKQTLVSFLVFWAKFHTGPTKEFLGKNTQKSPYFEEKNPDTSGGRQNIAGFLKNSNLLSDM